MEFKEILLFWSYLFLQIIQISKILIFFLARNLNFSNIVFHNF